MIYVTVGGKRQEYSGLSWTSVDPGGYESCSFQVVKKDQTILPGDEIIVYDDLTICWHGLVEEPGLRREGNRETYNVAGVGYSSLLKSSAYSMIYIDRRLSEWHDMPLQRSIGLGTAGFVPGGSFSVATGEASDGKPSLILQFEELNNNIATPRVLIVETWYDAGQGNAIASMEYDFETFDKSAGGLNTLTGATWNKRFGLTNAETNPTADNHLPTTGSGTNELLATTTRRYALIHLYFNATSSGTGDWKLYVEHLRIFGDHSLTKRGTSPYDGFYPSDIIKHAVTSSNFNFDQQIDESPQYVIQQSAYPTAVTPEQIINDANGFVAWHWGVWEPVSLLSDRPTFYFKAPPVHPTVSLRYEDCEGVDLTEKYSEIYNQAEVQYNLPNGSVGRVIVERSHPRYPDARDNTLIIQAGTVGSEDAAETIGLYQLALLQDSTNSAGSLTAPIKTIEGTPSHFIKPGLDKIKIVGFPNNLGFLADVASGIGSYRVRRLSVTVDNSVPHTQIEFDHGADLIEVMQARLANAVEASNVG